MIDVLSVSLVHKMAEDVRFRFFDIEQCGYYLRGEPVVPLFSGIRDTLERLGVWAQGQDMLVNTQTFEQDLDKSIRRSFFVDIHHDRDSGDIFLMMWNEVPHDHGQVYGMLSTQPPGTNDMLQTGFDDENAIPGVVSYFWFIPELNLFSSMKFEHSDHGKTELENYIIGYLNFKSDYRVTTRHSDDEVYGFSESGRISDTCTQVYPRFVSKTSQNNEIRQTLVSNISSINAIIKEQHFTYSEPDDRSFLEKFFTDVISDTPHDVDGVRSVKQRLEFRPTLDELNEIIDHYGDRDPSLKRVGFHISGDKDVYLDGANVIFSYELNVSRGSNQAINIIDLAQCVAGHRANLLRLYNGD